MKKTCVITSDIIDATIGGSSVCKPQSTDTETREEKATSTQTTPNTAFTCNYR